MYYIANFSVVSMENKPVVFAENSGKDTCLSLDENENDSKEAIFCQADLWNLQRQMRAIHVTDRFPRTWEGL